MTPISDKTASNILADLREGERLANLSNKELVKEYFKADENDLIVEEFCNRLWPNWADEEL